LDASRSVTVVEQLLGGKKADFINEIQSDYARVREHHQKSRTRKQLLPLKDAQANKFQIDWENESIVSPNKLGRIELSVTTEELIPYIDWTPFFRTWELHGKYPAILEDEVVGEEAKKLFKDAQAMLETIASEEWLKHKGIVGLFPANAQADDIVIYDPEDATRQISVQHTMRQQTKKADGVPNIALSDFVAPIESGKKDYIGAFVVTSGIGIDQKVAQFEADHDDYNSILLKALADRLAEAFAEYTHKVVRTDLWGYASNETLDNEALIKEEYRGIRPAPGYPACPDHTEKPPLFELLNASEVTGVELTDSMAMTPTASVSGWYFGSRHAKYFGVGKISQDQVQSLAERKGMEVEVMERWLSPNLH